MKIKKVESLFEESKCDLTSLPDGIMDKKIEFIKEQIEDFLMPEIDKYGLLDSTYKYARKTISYNNVMRVCGMRTEILISFGDSFEMNDFLLRQRIIHLSSEKDDFLLESIEFNTNRYWNIENLLSSKLTQIKIKILILDI